MMSQRRWKVQGRGAVGAISCTTSSCVCALPGAHPRSCVYVGVVEIQDTASANKVDDKSLRGEYTVRGGVP
jgi:hypothetical protein